MITLRALVVALVLLSFTVLTAHAADATRVFLIRHAEKVDDGSPDPKLSDAGRARARALVGAIGEEKLAAIFVTQFKRTAQTAGPIAQAGNLEPIVVTGDKGYADVMAKKIRNEYAGKIVLVVGHSNTTTELM